MKVIRYTRVLLQHSRSAFAIVYVYAVCLRCFHTAAAESYVFMYTPVTNLDTVEQVPVVRRTSSLTYLQLLILPSLGKE